MSVLLLMSLLGGFVEQVIELVVVGEQARLDLLPIMKGFELPNLHKDITEALS